LPDLAIIELQTVSSGHWTAA